jgi:uncharacterized glyoxalase superfamily protein PhnB
VFESIDREGTVRHMQSIYPVLEYEDARAAIEFLEHAFGFKRHALYAGEHGATIERELTDQDYGSLEFTARDPEGNLWSFGTYRPAEEGP